MASTSGGVALNCAPMKKPARVLLALAYLAFISLGLPDTVLGVAWPSLRHEFGIPQSAAPAVPGRGVRDVIRPIAAILADHVLSPPRAAR